MRRRVGHTDLAISSIIDTWILLQTLQTGGERNRLLYILKSRGMPHSNQIREFLIGDRGITLVDVYTGLDGVLTGSARATQEAQAQADSRLREQAIARRERQRDRRRKAIEAQIAALQAQLADEDTETGLDIDQAKACLDATEQGARGDGQDAAALMPTRCRARRRWRAYRGSCSSSSASTSASGSSPHGLAWGPGTIPAISGSSPGLLPPA